MTFFRHIEVDRSIPGERCSRIVRRLGPISRVYVYDYTRRPDYQRAIAKVRPGTRVINYMGAGHE